MLRCGWCGPEAELSARPGAGESRRLHIAPLPCRQTEQLDWTGTPVVPGLLSAEAALNASALQQRAEWGNHSGM